MRGDHTPSGRLGICHVRQHADTHAHQLGTGHAARAPVNRQACERMSACSSGADLEACEPRVARVGGVQRPPEPVSGMGFEKMQAGFEVGLVLRSQAR